MDVVNEIEVLENDVRDVEKKCSKVNCVAIYEAIMATFKLNTPWPSGHGGHTLLPWGRAAWVRSPPTPTHKTCLLSAVGDLK